MADFYEALTDELIRFIDAQAVFFTASACAQGRINLSPKGMDCFRVLGPTRCAYMDLTGSGNETAAHLKQDGRLTIMFTSFARAPLILRLYGQGSVIRPHHPEWTDLAPHFPDEPGRRQIIVIDIDSIQTSCGYGVPEMTFQRERPTLRKWAEKKGPDGITSYQKEKNQRSIDGFDTGLYEVGSHDES
ncbi:pyridoxamine 5'-phosphate oxidase [Iodidimonas gelatinilytica]|uniref:Pyridoxamine 5'-phosphate oxidase n=1 Tax=Iodidimonas gelatinilytica TaxID=1236966 RepID=A0A5A7MX41_9PROT|nr:pyridoxamine 5'-phosphate oxidase family protein [Iodidimonas gelatinilytica]GEQ99598.1 pyridoxamine 5'-phosphate oxidase [Iodidimonas gelatinilytica]